MRTVTAPRTGQWHIWDRDSGGPGYAFGGRDLMANEVVVKIEAAGKREPFRMYPDATAVEFADGAKTPDAITVTIATREEAWSLARGEKV